MEHGTHAEDLLSEPLQNMDKVKTSKVSLGYRSRRLLPRSEYEELLPRPIPKFTNEAGKQAASTHPKFQENDLASINCLIYARTLPPKAKCSHHFNPYFPIVISHYIGVLHWAVGIDPCAPALTPISALPSPDDPHLYPKNPKPSIP